MFKQNCSVTITDEFLYFFGFHSASFVTLCFSQGWKAMLFKSKDESISKVHTKTKELLIVDITNKKQTQKKKKQRYLKQRAKIIVIDAEIRTNFFLYF